ncbi:MAG: hypothetical protein J6Y37_02070 [Paludibacteraceae bacterium]|nr:hypothetical protein [Paludibacteraceae bacterium]
MKYENTGNFTEEQKRIAKRMRKVMDDASKAGLAVLAKSENIILVLKKDYRHSTMDRPHSKYMLKELEGGTITSAGASDQEYFEIGYIDE